MHSRTLALVAVAACAPGIDLAPTAGALQNDCADPAWATTLRCKSAAVPIATPGGPASVADVKPFTRVFLTADPNVRCFDGTPPTFYVDKAVGAPSNKWVFTVSGGGSCRPEDSDGDGVVDDAQRCVDLYQHGSASEMGTGESKPMLRLDGIYSPGAANPFASYNRVRIDKCTMDKMIGRASYSGLVADLDGDGVVDPATETFDAWSQGFNHITETLDALLGGLTYTTWIDQAGAVTAVQETLPALTAAEQILFVGHSGGAQGLMHNLDHLADELALRGVAADFRGLFDAQFKLSQENEAAFTGAGDVYDHVMSGTTSGNGIMFGFDSTHWQTVYKGMTDVWNVQLDASCLASPGPVWKCRDYMHVLMNHVATPFMIREDVLDTNHSRNVQIVEWGYCAAGPCDAGFAVPGELAPRLLEQSDRLYLDHHTRSELALNDDTTYADAGLPGETPSIALWIPACASHAGAYESSQFLGVQLPDAMGALHSMADVAVEFMALPRLGAQIMYRDDDFLTIGIKASICPP